MKTISLTLTFILVIVIVVEAFLLSQLPSKKQVLGTQIATSQSASSPEPENSSSLSEVVSKSLEGTKGTYSIYIKNLKTGETFHQNEHKTYEAASLYKLWTMATVYQQIEQGTLEEDQVLSQTIPALNNKFEISEEDAELTTGGITLTVKQAINQMITISHNYAALLLTEKIKVSSANTFIKENGFKESELGDPPQTTASDMALFFERLYKGDIVSQDSSQKMMETLKGQKLNNGIPKLLPAQTAVAHKTGDLGFFKHDAGIIFTPKGDYVFVVLSESTSPAGAQERIAQLSKDVYDYFQKK